MNYNSAQQQLLVHEPEESLWIGGKIQRMWMTIIDEHFGQPLVATLTEVNNNITQQIYGI